MGLFKRRRAEIPYDPATQRPAVRRSICTGEMTAGFIDKQTGKFQDLMRLDGPRALRDFCDAIGVREEEVETIY